MREKKRSRLLDEFDITTATRKDWPYFARWHYRGSSLGVITFATLLWHDTRPVGICLFSPGPRVLSQRNRYFGIAGKADSLSIKALNRQLVMLSRVVLHPSYRGAGIASTFIRKSCRHVSQNWIETQSQMGWINPVFEKAGFVRVGHAPLLSRDRKAYSGLYGQGEFKHGRKRLITATTHDQSRFSEPVYYILDNRRSARRPV